MTRAPLATRAALAAATSLLAACHSSSPSVRPMPAAAAPSTASCSASPHAAIAVVRARTGRVARTEPGALVVRLAAVDGGVASPAGPVRVTPASPRGSAPRGSASGGSAPGDTAGAHQLTVDQPGVARTGPLPAGRYVVEASGEGFQSRRFTVAVRPGATDTVRFRLAPVCGT